MVAEPVFPARTPARPRLRNSTPTRNARSRRSDGFSTALGSFRELLSELSRLLSLESSRRKQTHFILQYRKRSLGPPPPHVIPPPPASNLGGCGLRAR